MLGVGTGSIVAPSADSNPFGFTVSGIGFLADAAGGGVLRGRQSHLVSLVAPSAIPTDLQEFGLPDFIMPMPRTNEGMCDFMQNYAPHSFLSIECGEGSRKRDDFFNVVAVSETSAATVKLEGVLVRESVLLEHVFGESRGG